MSRAPIIEVRNLETRFGSQRIHSNLQLDIFSGEVLGIAGGSGSGKSLLLRILLGLHKPQRGQIRILGLPLPEGLPKLRSQWGVQFQSGALFSSLTVGENIKLPLQEWTDLSEGSLDAIVHLKLQLVGLRSQDAQKYPGQLSGGMIKRASLARALALDPPLLFLDEPTAGLDPLSSIDYEKLIEKLRHTLGLTVVMITHDLHSLEYLADRIAILVDQKAIVGTLAELLHHPHPWIQNYFASIREQCHLSEDH